MNTNAAQPRPTESKHSVLMTTAGRVKTRTEVEHLEKYAVR